MAKVITTCKCRFCSQVAEVRQFNENTKSAIRGHQDLYIYCPDCGANTRFKRGSSGQQSLKDKYLSQEPKPKKSVNEKPALGDGPVEPSKKEDEKPLTETPPKKKGAFGDWGWD